jgi:hypothetical protein
MKYVILFLLTLSLLFPKNAFATYNPLERPNNKYGIHIVDENDLTKAAKLVNSQGGDWGYVTIVIQENERKVEKWNQIFASMHELHLIPIVRLATKIQGQVWKKPQLSEVIPWTDFLDSLSWVTKNKYVILFNEPNHAKEWGGDLNPPEYAQIVSSFSATLKQKSDDFFVLAAGFDTSAPNSSLTMDELAFVKAMIGNQPDIFSKVDGWVSHSYPNPGFTSSVDAKGRGTIATYQWERQMLKNLRVEKKLPIFITETGWPHTEGLPNNKNYFSSEKIAEFIPQAAETVWNDADIVAITPFILNYQSIPFSNFSWQKVGEENFYPQYEAYRNLTKSAGNPLLSQYWLTPTPTITPILTPTSPPQQILGISTGKGVLFSFLSFISKFISLNI